MGLGPPVKHEKLVGRASVPAAFGGTGFQPVRPPEDAGATKNFSASVSAERSSEHLLVKSPYTRIVMPRGAQHRTDSDGHAVLRRSRGQPGRLCRQPVRAFAGWDLIPVGPRSARRPRKPGAGAFSRADQLPTM